MPKQKDLKRVIRARMEKTGESYTAARLNVVRKQEPDYSLAGMSDEAVTRGTGRSWRDWVRLLDEAGCTSKPHREIAKYVATLGPSSWWSQSVTVGYERIRGLRAHGQRRGGGFEANKSRTFAVPVSKLYKAFATARTRARWLGEQVKMRSSTPGKRMRIELADGAMVEVGFFPRGDAKSYVAITQGNLPDKAAAERVKARWAERFEMLAAILS